MICPQCRIELPEESKFCLECGRKIDFTCSGCGKTIPLDSKFCPECGHDQRQPKDPPKIDYHQPQSYTPKHLAEKILTMRSAIEGERKIVTVMFTDVAGFSTMSEKLDPEDVHQVMDGCFRILLDQVHACEGTVNEFRGDGVMALFGAPIAHEDHASMEEIVKKGDADYISLCRALIADPAFPEKIRSGSRELSRCIHCNLCGAYMISRPLKCYYGKMIEIGEGFLRS